MHRWFWARFFTFCSSGPVQNARPSDVQMANRGTACGRPSARTVHSVNFWVRRSAPSVCDHGCAVALGPENGPRSVLGSEVMSSSFVRRPRGTPSVQHGAGVPLQPILKAASPLREAEDLGRSLAPFAEGVVGDGPED